MLSKPSSRQHPIFLVIIYLVWMIAITLPYVYAASVASPDHVFGGFLINPFDGNSYLAKMYQGWQGEWRFRLPYSANPGQGAYIFMFYLFLGHLARWAGISLIFIYHLVRIICSIVFFLTLYYRLVLPLSGEGRSTWLFLVLLFGSGLGWLVFPFGLVTSDYWVAEAYPFLSAYSNPHFTLGMALLLWLIPLENSGTRSLPPWLVVILALLLAVIAPFGVVVALLVTGGMLAWEIWRGASIQIRHVSPSGINMRAVFTTKSMSCAKRMAWIALGGGPVMLYDLIISQTDPVLSGWNAQNITHSPPLWDLLLSLSPMFLLALLGAWWAWKRDSTIGRVFLCWVILGLIWLYLPLNLQRRLMMGLYIPFAGLATFGLDWLYQKIGARTRRLAIIALLLSLPTNMLVLMAAGYGIQIRDPMFYLSMSETHGLNWIRNNTTQDALVLASSETSLFIPAHTGRRVLVGHPFETVNSQAQEEAVSGFFTKQDGTSGADFLRQWSVDYLFFGPRERVIGLLPKIGILDLIYSNGEVGIYQVLENDGASP